MGEPALRPRREVLDYAKAGGGSGSSPSAAGGGSFMKVFIRLRPSEMNGSTGELPYSFPEPNKISIKENRDPFPAEHQFAFHRVYDKGATQEELYRDVASASVQHVFHGFNACIFAYGQTGSGKTYTMYGPNVGDRPRHDAASAPGGGGGGTTSSSSIVHSASRGIVPRCAEAIFSEAEGRTPFSNSSVAVSLCEIYCDKIRDLGKAYAVRGDKSAAAQAKLLRLKTSELHAQARTQSHGFAAGDPNNISSLYALENLEVRGPPALVLRARARALRTRARARAPGPALPGLLLLVRPTVILTPLARSLPPSPCPAPRRCTRTPRARCT